MSSTRLTSHSTAKSNAPSQYPIRIRNKESVACTRCSRSHIGCVRVMQNGLPRRDCGPCIARGAECIWPENRMPTHILSAPAMPLTEPDIQHQSHVAVDLQSSQFGHGLLQSDLSEPQPSTSFLDLAYRRQLPTHILETPAPLSIEDLRQGYYLPAPRRSLSVVDTGLQAFGTPPTQWKHTPDFLIDVRAPAVPSDTASEQEQLSRWYVENLLLSMGLADILGRGAK